MTKRCRDTSYYLAGEKVRSGRAWVLDPASGERLRVVSGRSPVGPGRVHVGALSVGTRVYTENGASALVDPERLYGRRGRTKKEAVGPRARGVVRQSSQIAILLRHGRVDLVMDEAGWVDKSEVTRVLGYSEAEINAAILYNDKGRLEAYGDKIRAVQGHSAGSTSVTQEALEASWERVAPVGLLYHATRTQNVEAISETGISAQGRTHVHLSETRERAGTTRGRAEALVIVDAQKLAELGTEIFRAPNGVILVRAVPPVAIKEILIHTSLE